MAEEVHENSDKHVTVEIYDQPYHLSGPDTEHLRQLAAKVDSKMRTIADQSHTVDSLRVAVLTALNLADELSRATRSAANVNSQLEPERTSVLCSMLDEVLDERSQ